MAGAVLAVILLDLVRFIATNNFHGHIVEGVHSKIEDFPYIVSLFIRCHEPGINKSHFVCGGSIVNQMVILTAAHCLEGCKNFPKDFFVAVGNANRFKGTVYPISKVVVHPEYRLNPVMHDIAVAQLGRPLVFGHTVKKIVLMKHPPYFKESAVIAGWGHVKEYPQQGTNRLIHTNQKVLHREECLKTLPWVPTGLFCARPTPGNGYAASGDSGSPLVVHKYIQIGLVSYKSQVDTKLIVYTDTGYYYDWIEIQVSALMCDETGDSELDSELRSDSE